MGGICSCNTENNKGLEKNFEEEVIKDKERKKTNQALSRHFSTYKQSRASLVEIPSRQRESVAKKRSSEVPGEIVEFSSLVQADSNSLEGFHILHLDEERTFKGELRRGKAEGWGLLRFPNSDEFVGEFRGGVPKGFGVFYSGGRDETRVSYEGYWNKDKLSGIAVESNFNKFPSVFEGEFRDGKRKGIGKLIWENGTVYEGEFNNDNIEGVVWL